MSAALMMIQTWALANQQEDFLMWNVDDASWWRREESENYFELSLALTDDGFEFRVYSGQAEDGEGGLGAIVYTETVTKLSQVRALFDRDWAAWEAGRTA